jgi:hypothetical protein
MTSMLTRRRLLGIVVYALIVAFIDLTVLHLNSLGWLARDLAYAATFFPAAFFAPELFGLRVPRQSRRR